VIRDESTPDRKEIWDMVESAKSSLRIIAERYLILERLKGQYDGLRRGINIFTYMYKDRAEQEAQAQAEALRVEIDKLENL